MTKDVVLSNSCIEDLGIQRKTKNINNLTQCLSSCVSIEYNIFYDVFDVMFVKGFGMIASRAEEIFINSFSSQESCSGRIGFNI